MDVSPLRGLGETEGVLDYQGQISRQGGPAGTDDSVLELNCLSGASSPSSLLLYS